MSMYRREHAGFDYELWLRRGHTGTPDDFLEWLRGPKGDPADLDSIEVENLTEEARRIFQSGYLPIAHETIYGSLEMPTNRTVQGITSFVDNGAIAAVYPNCEVGDEYIVFCTAYVDKYGEESWLYLYNYTRDKVVRTVQTTTLPAFGGTVPVGNTEVETGATKPVWGHCNDITYCPVDNRLYIANFTYARIDIVDTTLTHWGQIKLWEKFDANAWRDPNNLPDGIVPSDSVRTELGKNQYYLSQLGGIAWSDKEQCFYLRFRGPRNVYRVSQDFKTYEHIPMEFGSMSSQGIYIERETGNLMTVKFRTGASFRFPPGNRIEVRNTSGGLIGTSYLNPPFELEGITEMRDGQYIMLYNVSNTTYGSGDVPNGDLVGRRRRAALFTRGTLSSRAGISLYSSYQKNFLDHGNYQSMTNNIYYREAGHVGTTGDTIMETGGKDDAPFKTWPSIQTFLFSNTTKLLRVHLLSDLNWPIRLYDYERNIEFVGEDEAVPVATLAEDANEGGTGDAGSTASLEEAEGTAKRAIRDIVINNHHGYARFDNISVGGINLKLTRANKVYFNECDVHKTDANTVRRGIGWVLPFSSAKSYNAGDLCYFVIGGVRRLHQALVDISAGEWDSEQWLFVGTPINYVQRGDFDPDTIYATGERVIHMDTDSDGSLVGYYYTRNKWGEQEEPHAEGWNPAHWTRGDPAFLSEDTWSDNDMLSFTACDLTGVSEIDLLRTRLVLLKYITAYGTATRFHGVGTSYRIYGNTTAAEQYALRGQPSATPNITCSELTKISQIRMGMNMSVSAVTAGKMTDIPFWIRNGDWDNGTATCSTAGDVAEKAITVAGISALTDGLEFLIKFTHANTYDGDLTLNLNGLGAVPLLFGDWTDGEQVCVKYFAPDLKAGTAARFVRYGLAFTGRAEVLNDSAMLYTIQHGGEEYRRVVEFGAVSDEDTRTLRIISDSGWQTRDDEIYPINTVVRPEAMARNWVGKKVVVFGDSITNWSHGGYWTNYLQTEAGCTVNNYAVSGAGFARGDAGSRIIDQINGTPPAGYPTDAPEKLPQADVVIIAAGTNDANSAISGGDIRTAIEGVITAIRAATAAPIIFITPIRRSHDSSGGDDTNTYSRQRLVGAAICNVAVLNDCSVVNGYDFPIATTGTEWVTDMTLDGLHPEAAGKNVYAHSFLSAVGYEYKNTIKILGIGNSHTRDALYYLYEILAHAGYNATVGHYFWGESSLKEQYAALMDEEGTLWPTDGKDYYRKYDKGGTLLNHRHADDHVHKLDYALTDEDWDVVVFQNKTTECAHYTGFYAPDFNIDTFVDEVKQRVGNPELRVGLMAPHTRSSDYAGDTIDGDLYTPDMLDGAIQSTVKAVAADMKHCDFIVNSGLAIRYARADENLDALGHDMTRIDLTNTEPPVNKFDKIHLEYGVPMFIAAMSYAMAICGDEVGCISWTPGAPAFDARKIYGKNDVLEYNGTLYRKNVSTAAEAWDDSHWDEHDNAYLAYLGKLCARRAAFPTLERGSRTYYGVCDTATATAAKEVTTVNGDFVLETGAMVRVRFVNENSSTGTTVNVDGTGAKTLKNLGGTAARYAWRPNEDVDLVYNGTDYDMEGKGTATTGRFGMTILEDAADSTGKDKALAPNALAYNMRYIITGASIYDTGTTYTAGDRARKGNYLYEANKTTTGTWKAADWDVVDPLQTQIDALESRITALGG